MQIKATLICCAIFCLGLIDLIQADGETAPVQAATTPSPSNDEIDLDSMTNEELEEICTSRGFEVVKEKDGDTGEMKTYSHEDYINAARQCLEIESEMYVSHESILNMCIHRKIEDMQLFSLDEYFTNNNFNKFWQG